MENIVKFIKKEVVPGVTTGHLDKISEEFCRDHGATPAFKGYRGFPCSLCASINEQVVHGIPDGTRTLIEGDIVSLDFGVKYNGFFEKKYLSR